MIGLLRREARALAAAWIYFTRVPLPLPLTFTAEDWRHATSWWPLIGAGMGAVSGGILLLAGPVWGAGLAAGLALAVGLLLGGAQHEDGFGDCCDGFGGGGENREKILEIMKDSRVGAFAVVGLVLLLGLKWQALAALPPALLLLGPIAAATLSRAAAAGLMAVLPYARSGPSRAAPVTSLLRGGRLLWPLLLGVAPLWVLPPHAALAAAAVALVGWALAAVWFRRRLGGYTGDGLGATQQVIELAVLLTLLALAGVP